jgi:hypothetical protein
MENDEKRFLMIALMRDLRADWSHDYETRANKVKELATDLDHPATIVLVDSYFNGIKEYGDADGRHFRTPWQFGGYEGAPWVKPVRVSKELMETMQIIHYPEEAFKMLIEVV